MYTCNTNTEQLNKYVIIQEDMSQFGQKHTPNGQLIKCGYQISLKYHQNKYIVFKV